MSDGVTMNDGATMNDELPTPTLGAEGEPCPACGALLAADQRYCLNCGRRRAGARVPYADLLAGRAPEDVLRPASKPPPPPPPERRGVPVAVAAVAAGSVALVLALGVLLGAATTDDPPRQLAAAPVQQKPAVINVNAGVPTESTEEFTSDWPAGEEGWTVQLEALPKDSSQVADVDQAKTDAEGAGATEVGALDSDEWVSLDPGEYVVYSGVFTGKGAADKARAAAKKLKKDFPDAKAVKVSAGDVPGAEGTRPEEKVQKLDDSALNDLENSTGADQQEKSSKLPDTLGLEGEPPPVDRNGDAGGGSDTEVIE